MVNFNLYEQMNNLGVKTMKIDGQDLTYSRLDSDGYTEYGFEVDYSSTGHIMVTMYNDEHGLLYQISYKMVDEEPVYYYLEKAYNGYKLQHKYTINGVYGVPYDDRFKIKKEHQELRNTCERCGVWEISNIYKPFFMCGPCTFEVSNGARY